LELASRSRIGKGTASPTVSFSCLLVFLIRFCPCKSACHAVDFDEAVVNLPAEPKPEGEGWWLTNLRD
jgi:hypothetical protein